LKNNEKKLSSLEKTKIITHISSQKLKT